METTDKNEIIIIIDKALDRIKGEHIQEICKKFNPPECLTPVSNDTPSDFLGWGWGCLIVAFIICVIIIYFSKSRDRTKLGAVNELWSEEKRNSVLVSSWFVILCLLAIAFYFFGFIRLPKAELFISEEDVFIIFVSIIAILGAIWALLARIDAEKAFNKSKEILAVLGDTFPLYDIVSNGKATPILQAIGKSGYTVSLFIGFPCIGYLYRDKEKLNVKPDRLFTSLKGGLETIRTNNRLGELRNFKFHLSVFSKEDTLEIFRKYNNQHLEPTKDIKDIKELEELIVEFYQCADKLLTDEKNGIFHSSVSVKVDLKMKPDENLRFISLIKENPVIDATNKDFNATNKVIVWIVKNLKHEDVSFDSQCFQSNDLKLINIVQTAFDNNNSSNGLHNGTDATP